jgi:peptide-methionine (S)-S-oxide reductase
MLFLRKKAEMPDPTAALPGRATPIPTSARHVVNGRSIKPPFPAEHRQLLLGMGCFWGAERKFWQLDTGAESGLYVTAVGYAAGFTPNPTYEEVCSGRTGHNEVVLVVYDPAKMPLSRLLQVFFESHDPTQGMRQGNDVGTQYRSGLYLADESDLIEAKRIRDSYQASLSAAGHGRITTEILPMPDFYYAEDYHQQYLARNPGGYCGLGGTGVSCPMPLAAAKTA